MRIVVLASFNMDLVMRAERRPEPGETLQGDFAMFPGGKGFNQAIAFRRLGADVAVIGRVGDDVFGEQFRAALAANGVDATHVAVDAEASTGVAIITVERSGENAIIQAPQANRRVEPDDIEQAADAFDGASMALLQLETSMPAAIAFARMARERGVPVLLNPAPAAAVPDALLALCDILVPNAIEAETLLNAPIRNLADAQEAAQALRRRGPATVVVTLGGSGAIAASDEWSGHVASFHVDAVDTTGAGDAFCAALAVRLGEGASIEQAVDFACAAGALAVTKQGAEPSMPRREDIEALLAKEERS